MSFQIIYEPSTHRALAVIGHNNPYLRSFPEVLCRDVCSLVTWIGQNGINLDDLTKGAMYCCSILDFIQNVMPILANETFATAGLFVN